MSGRDLTGGEDEKADGALGVAPGESGGLALDERSGRVDRGLGSNGGSENNGTSGGGGDLDHFERCRRVCGGDEKVRKGVRTKEQSRCDVWM